MIDRGTNQKREALQESYRWRYC